MRLEVEGEESTEVSVQLPNGPGAPAVDEGDDVLLLHMETPDGVTWSVIDHQRGTQLWILAGVFVLAVVAFGRWRGVTSLLGLALTFAVLLFFVVPGILGGESPLLIALVGSSAIVLSVLYLTHGVSLVTTVAVLGTLASLALTGVLASVTVEAMHLTGITDDVSTVVGMEFGVNMQGLLLAGIMIGSLGVLDDVTVTQSATVTEIARANPAYSPAHLYRAGSRVGRSHIASVINTIILAYAGATLPLFVLIVANNASLGGVVSDQVIAQEIVRSAVATIGLIAAVPLTTALAAIVARHTSR
ncbi:YibE/F family protein [Nocardioides gilvus]|uniref:YibE/F family protein n=1 Tax=Nocardioides gilvus TaxID=1735589 RepID=UPI000D745D07|nr:YibE/F family protein [Nocardioides gilvus]